MASERCAHSDACSCQRRCALRKVSDFAPRNAVRLSGKSVRPDLALTPAPSHVLLSGPDLDSSERLIARSI